MSTYTEDNLVQQTTADYFQEHLGWDSVYAYNNEDFGPDSLLGRDSDRQVILRRYLHQALEELNQNLPEDVYQQAIQKIEESSASQTAFAVNREKYELLKNGVPVSYRAPGGELKRDRLRVFNFDEPEKNHFLCARELWIKGDLYRRRADIVGFVNGIPLLFIECKNVHKDIKVAYDKNLSDYKDTIPHIFYHNAMVILGNGIKARFGSVFSKYEHFTEWKRLSEEEPGVVDMETLLKGICNKQCFIDLFENFIVFDDSSGKPVKIIAKNHQFLGVNRAIESVKDRNERQGKLGVFWHTQGAGKSYSMVFFSRKVRRKMGNNFTFLILTDRDDLDTQIYNTFAGCGLADNDKDPCRAKSGDHLQVLLGQQKACIFSLIQKFNKPIGPDEPYSQRNDIIVISDEAHRTQYGLLALNMHNALPYAGYIGFTGTPLFKDDEITRRYFGDYVSTYDFQRAVDDEATVPLYYDARGDKLKFKDEDGNVHQISTPQSLNEKIAEKLEELEIEDINVQLRLERELQREYHIITAEKRLDQIAKDFVKHYSTAWECGKVMLVCIDKLTCVRMYYLISKYWQLRIKEAEKVKGYQDEQTESFRRRHLAWLKETQMAVVISEEQGEVDTFRKWGLDIKPHRKLLKQGFDIPEHLRKQPEYSGMQRLDPDSAFKEENHPFRIAIVCAMWLTGFDVPCLTTLYLDKPLKAHTLMQAIARANRIYEGKNNGLIVDYCGILKNLRKALATFAGQGDTGHGGNDTEINPIRSNKKLLADLAETIEFVEKFLKKSNASLEDIIVKTGFEKNAAIAKSKEAANENDETRKRFEVMCREVFKKFKACINIKKINDYRDKYEAINIIYRSLQEDRNKSDIWDIIKQLHEIIDKNIHTIPEEQTAEHGPYDISKIDFTKLKKEFEHSPIQKTTVQNLKQAIESRLHNMLARNPMRSDWQKQYEEIITDYNREKDRATIEKTFEDLLKYMKSLDEEESRAMREGLDEESLAIFDILRKDELTKSERKKIKKISVKLLQTLKVEKLRIDHWRDKEATRDNVHNTIYNYLYSDQTGLPVKYYSEDEVKDKTDDVFRHVFQVYPTLPSPYYTE
ncbi:type I restriction endonuclease subunit R, partial [bacterium]|nr:type I restriction endonuclease subunit R [bacterium]